MITGISHINIAVKDIETSFAFYKNVMGFKPLCKSEGSAYFLAGEPDEPGCLWLSLDLDRDKLRIPSPCNTHIAFSIDSEHFEKIAAQIMASGAQIYKANDSPGNSLYFLDPDGHKLEIHDGTWQSRIAFRKQTPGKWKNIEWFV